ncbi:hypothetical protein JIG36_16875 [Actinoplanes sp. LDG1-06]|uniref:Uncharacterized protein n=1 Tax=Paractinoplanes ovalisporus TaxID=2810368 RepID=A0ABS2ABM1_9ACTN|nr:hypothetical protein [Actinoplanes ovalisporus]MBM2617229.1 hypothetical protein [Actinoplanes ovalisporus]
MRSLGTRRVALAAGVATVAVIALAGCSAGQVAETAMLKTPISGLNTESPDGRLLIRNLQVVYNDPEGYPANSDAPLEISLFNQTTDEMTVLISSKPLQDEVAGVVSAQQIGLTGSAAPAASASAAAPSTLPSAGASSAPATPAEPALEPARITIPPLGSAVYLPEDDQKLMAAGLSDELVPGHSLSLVLEVSGQSQPIELTAPFAVPLSPASRAPGEAGENHE